MRQFSDLCISSLSKSDAPASISSSSLKTSLSTYLSRSLPKSFQISADKAVLREDDAPAGVRRLGGGERLSEERLRFLGMDLVLVVVFSEEADGLDVTVSREPEALDVPPARGLAGGLAGVLVVLAIGFADDVPVSLEDVVLGTLDVREGALGFPVGDTERLADLIVGVGALGV